MMNIFFEQYFRQMDADIAHFRGNKMNYRPIWNLGPLEVGRNSQVFATDDEALASAKARFNDWTTPTDYGIEETNDPVTYVRKDNKDYSLKGMN